MTICKGDLSDRMSDAELRDERDAQRLVDEAENILRNGGPRALAIVCLQGAAHQSSLRDKDILRFVRALKDPEVNARDAIHDYSPQRNDWDMAIAGARRGDW